MSPWQGHYPSHRKSFFYEKRARILAITYAEEKDRILTNQDATTRQVNVTEDDFLDLFYGGQLHPLESLIQGYKPEGKGAFKVTFINAAFEDQRYIEFERELCNSIENGVIFENGKKKKLQVKLFKPRSPKKTITLRPVPIEYRLEDLKPILEGWGTLFRISRGLHKQVGVRRRLKNEYVHVQYNINEIDESAIPQFFELEGHYVYVSKPNESLKIQCGYCHGYWHSEELCYKKKKRGPRSTTSTFLQLLWCFRA